MSLQRERELFEACLAADSPGARERLLSECPDAALVQRVRSLLAAHAAADSRGAEFLAAAPAFATPESIGPYRLLERLGEGAMGEVYLAEQRTPVRRVVALKIIKLGMDTREVIARFELERQSLALMAHPSVARILDAGATAAGRPYFVMEYVPGLPITRYCDQRRLALPARLELLAQVCAGVQHAHQRGIIHRDLKPSNILVCEIDGQPVPKIIDFGIAKVTGIAGSADDPHTRLGGLLGTPGYMSPEQAQLSPLDIDTRADIYSLGAVLYELLTGTVPPSAAGPAGEPPAGAALAAAEELPAPSRSVRLPADSAIERALRRGTTPERLEASLRGDLDWIVLKAMAADRTRRYESAAELCTDIQRFLRNEPVSAGPPSRLYRVRKFARRHRVSVAAGATALVLIIASAGLAFWQARETARERDRAALEARTSRQVSQFLIDVFEVSDPESNRGATVTARELLENAAARLDRDLAEQPLVLARLQSAIGEVFFKLGAHERADRHFARALALYDGRVESDHLDRLTALRGVARSAIRLTRFERAERHLREVIDLARRRYGTGHAVFADATNDLASLYFHQGRFGEAARQYELAYRGRVSAYGIDARQSTDTLTNIAVVQAILGDEQRAQSAFRRVIGQLRRRFGDDHPQVLVAEQNLATLYGEMGRAHDARALLETLVPRVRRVFGEQHPYTLTTSGNLASQLRATGEPEAALDLHRRVADAAAVALGADGQGTLNWRMHVAIDLAALGRAAEALPMLQSVIDRQTAVLGPEHRDTLESRRALGRMLCAERRHAEGLRVLEESLQRATVGVAPHAPLTRSVLLALADCAYAGGLEEAARRWLGEARRAGADLSRLTDYPALERRAVAPRPGPQPSSGAAMPRPLR